MQEYNNLTKHDTLAAEPTKCDNNRKVIHHKNEKKKKTHTQCLHRIQTHNDFLLFPDSLPNKHIECECDTVVIIMGVRDQFRLLGGLRSVARIFYTLLARKSSGFARIFTCIFTRKWLFEKLWGGGGELQPTQPPPPPFLVRLWSAYFLF